MRRDGVGASPRFGAKGLGNNAGLADVGGIDVGILAEEISATAEASKQEQSVTALRSDVDDLKQNTSTTMLTLQETQKNVKDALESPAAIHFKGVTLTPGGFVAAETVTRQRATSADINTPFTGIPYTGNDLSHVPESNFTARQSRLKLSRRHRRFCPARRRRCDLAWWLAG